MKIYSVSVLLFTFFFTTNAAKAQQFSNESLGWQGSKPKFTWTAQDVPNVSVFWLERTTDGINFNSVNKIEGTLGTPGSYTETTYSLLDYSYSPILFPGFVAYRIRGMIESNVPPYYSYYYSRVISL